FREDTGALRGSEHQQNAIQIWDVASGVEIARVVVPPEEGQRFAVAGLALSPDHRLAAFGMHGDNTVRIWEIASESERARLAGHGGVVTSVAFSADGRSLASGSEDTTVLVWDLERPFSAKAGRPARLSGEELSSA